MVGCPCRWMPGCETYSYRDWRREHPEYRENMRRIGRSWWMREFGLRRLRIVRAVHPAYRRSHDPFRILTDEAKGQG